MDKYIQILSITINFFQGPLTYTKGRGKGSRTYAIGIVSFDIGRCGDPHYPGIYARIASELKWINDNMDKTDTNIYVCPR